MTIQAQREGGLLAATVEIERKVRELAFRHGKHVDHCTWNLGQRTPRSDTYRLDICVDDRVVKVYFTEHELEAYWDSSSGDNTNTRLGYVMSGLGGGTAWSGQPGYF